jgi:hypothetical protein
MFHLLAIVGEGARPVPRIRPAGDIQLGKLPAIPRYWQNQAVRAGHTGHNVALAALIEHTIEHNFSARVSVNPSVR